MNRWARRAAASRCRRFAAARAGLNGFTLDRGRLSIPSDDWFDDPVRLIELFALAARDGLEIHPAAMRAAARDARSVDGVATTRAPMPCSSRC